MYIYFKPKEKNLLKQKKIILLNLYRNLSKQIFTFKKILKF